MGVYQATPKSVTANKSSTYTGEKVLQTIESLPGWKYLIFVEGIYLLLSFSLFFSWPQPWPDEVQFADAARTLSEKGYLGTALVKGMETHVYWQPPLCFIILALVIKVVGFDFAAMRVFSVIVGCLVITASYIFGLKVAKNSIAPKIGVLLLALNPNFVNYVKLVRMDGLCVLSTLSAIIFYLQVRGHTSRNNYLLIGIFLALAVLLHPLGFIGVVAILTHQFFEEGTARRKIRNMTLLLLPVLVGLGLWAIYILDDANNFIVQMNFQFKRKALSPQLSVVHFLERYRSIPFFLLLFFLGAINLVQLESKEKSKRYIFLIIVLFISLIAIALTFALPYHVYFLSYASVAIAIFLVDGFVSSVKIISFASRLAVIVLLVNFLLYFGYLNFVFHYQLRKEANYEDFVSRVESYIPSRSTVFLSGYPSLFWGLRKSPKNYSFCENIFLNEEMSRKIIEQIDYVIMSRGFNPREDQVDLDNERKFLEDLGSKTGRRVHAVATVGVKERFAYSAEIYSVGPSSTP